MTDTMPPPTPDPSDAPTPVDNPSIGANPNPPKKIDVIEMMRGAHGEAHDVAIAQQKLAADNAARPLPGMVEALSQKALRQLKAALGIFHEIRGAADNLRPAIAAVAVQGGKIDPRVESIAAVLQSLLVGIEQADDLIQKHLDVE